MYFLKYLKLFLNRLFSFIENRQILTNKKIGFRTVPPNAIFDLLISFYHKLDDLDECLCLFNEMTKVFDLLSHDKLKEKLKGMGI